MSCPKAHFHYQRPLSVFYWSIVTIYMCFLLKFARFGIVLLVILAASPIKAEESFSDVYMVLCLHETDPKLARASAEKSLAGASQAGQLVEEYKALQVLIAVGELEKDVEAVQRYSKRAHELTDKIGKPAQEQVRAEISRAKQIFTTAGKVRELSLLYGQVALADTQSNALSVAVARLQLSNGLNRANLPDQALIHLQFAQRHIRETDREMAAQLWLGLAETHLALDDPKTAFADAQRALPLATNDSLMAAAYYWSGRSTVEPERVASANSYLTKAFDKALNAQNFDQFQFLYRQLAASQIKTLKQEGQSGLVASVLAKYQVQSAQLALAEKETENARVEVSHQKVVVEKDRLAKLYGQLYRSYRQNRSALIGLLVLVFVIVSAVMWWMLQRTKKLNDLLNSQKLDIIEKNLVLSQQNELLQTLNTDKNDLMSMLAHDMRSPLNAVVGLSQLLEMEGNLNSDQQLYIQKMHESVNRANQMIRELLDVNALEQRAAVALIPVDLPHLVADLITDLRPSAQTKQIRIFLGREISNGELHTAPDLVKRVVENLLTNAIKFSPIGKNIFVSMTETASHVSISVRDEGPGLTPQDRERLFRKFQKLSAQPTGGEVSTGLGLAIVKALVEKINGEIRVESEPGKGAEFIVKLPKQMADLGGGAR